MRKDAREAVYKILYAYSFVGEFDAEFQDEIFNELNLNSDDREFALRLIETIKANYDKLTEIISNLAVNYLIERIYVTDKCALIIGLCEMTYFDDVPNIVAINESLSLCKKYSTEKSLAFVNGIFANYKTTIEETTT